MKSSILQHTRCTCAIVPQLDTDFFLDRYIYFQIKGARRITQQQLFFLQTTHRPRSLAFSVFSHQERQNIGSYTLPKLANTAVSYTFTNMWLTYHKTTNSCQMFMTVLHSSLIQTSTYKYKLFTEYSAASTAICYQWRLCSPARWLHLNTVQTGKSLTVI